MYLRVPKLLNPAFLFGFAITFNVSAQSQFSVYEASISEIQNALESGQTNSVQLVEQYLNRIQAYDKQGPMLNSIVRNNPRAMEIAKALDEERQLTGPRSLLHGVPIVIKDNYNTNDMPTTGGSVALANFVPDENAAQVDKLLQAGAIIMAKTNLHEYAYGITSISSLMGQTRNPYDPRRVPGGSSGGTGAAVAASFAAAGFGSDTCGSIRIPAAFNNLIGLRPSKGLSSIYGILPLSHTQDVAGPLARSAEDLAIILDLVVGFDARDEATEIMRSAAAPRFLERLNSVNLAGLRIAKLIDYFERSDSAIRQTLDEALQWYEQQGAEIIEIETPELSSLIGRSGLIGHEFRTDIDQYFAEFADEESLNLSTIVDLGLYHQSVDGVLTRSSSSERNEEDYRSSLAARGELRAAIEKLFSAYDLDVIAYPTITRTPVFTGEPQLGSNCRISANSGLPALSMPAGFTDSGLPVGLELLGRFMQDPELLAIAQPYEMAMRTRQAPSTTPALESGLAPQIKTSRISFDQQGVSVDATFEFDVVKNQFSYIVSKNTVSGQEIYAVTLVIDRMSDGELNDPVVLNLLPPDVDSAAGNYYMSSEFRLAYTQQRLYLKVFAQPFTRSGATQLIQ